MKDTAKRIWMYLWEKKYYLHKCPRLNFCLEENEKKPGKEVWHIFWPHEANICLVSDGFQHVWLEAGLDYQSECTVLLRAMPGGRMMLQKVLKRR